MTCCLFIDSPIYSHLCQLVVDALVILTKLITESYCCTFALAPPLIWDVNYISAIQSHFIFPSLREAMSFIESLLRVNRKDF